MTVAGGKKKPPAGGFEAREMLQRTLARDSTSAFAWSLLADTYAADVMSRSLHLRGASRPQWLQLASEAAERAYALDPNPGMCAPRPARVRWRWCRACG